MFDVQRPVAGDPRRPRLPRDRRADRRGPALDELRHAGLRPEPRQLGAHLVAEAVEVTAPFEVTWRTVLHVDDLRRLEGQRRGLGRGHHGLPGRGDPRAEGAAAARVELREHVVEQEQRADGQQLRLGEEQREHREALLALRAELAQVAVAARDEDVVEMRAETGRAAFEVGLQASLELLDGRRLGVVAELRDRQPELVGTLREPRPERRERLAAGADERRPELGEARRPGLERLARREAELHPPERRRSAARAPRGTPAAARPAPGSSRPRTRSKYARRAAGPPLTTASRSGVKTSVETSRRSDSDDVEPRAVQLGPLRLGRREAHPERRRDTRPRAPRSRPQQPASPKRISCASLRVRGEKPCVPTCSDSSRFVLPAPFWPDDEHDARRQGELDRRVRAVVAKRDCSDDQLRGLTPRA